MKTKLTFLLMMIGFAFTDVHAYVTVTMQGGGRNQRFDYVNCSRTSLVCRGCGSLVCPVVWQIGTEKGINYQISDVVDYVTKRIESGDKSGADQYQGQLPVKWTAVDEGFSIDIEATEIIQKHD